MAVTLALTWLGPGCRQADPARTSLREVDLEALTAGWEGGTTTLFAADGAELAEVRLERCAPLPFRHIPTHLVGAFMAAGDNGACSASDTLAPLIAALEPSSETLDLEVPAMRELCSLLRTAMFGDPDIGGLRWIPLSDDTWLPLEDLEPLRAAHLNLVEIGGGDFGVEAGARAWFGQSATRIDAAEAAFLAVIATRPDLRRDFAALKRSRDRVLERMDEQGTITTREANLGRATPVPRRRAFYHPRTEQPSFVAGVSAELEQRLGGTRALRRGLRVRTTLDPLLQASAGESILPVLEVWRKNRETESARLNELIDEYGNSLDDVPEGEVKPGSRLNVPDEPPQVAVLALEAISGRVRVLLDSASESNVAWLGAMNRRRQPGSAWKPMVYELGIDQGMSQADVFTDAPFTYQIGGDAWSPRNHDEKYLGPVTLRKALASSLNSVAIQLIRKVGPGQVVERARQLGIKSDLDPVPSLALGSSPVTLGELVAAYGVFASAGRQLTPRFVDQVEDADGRAIPWSYPQGVRVIDPRVAYVMTDMLREVTLSGTAAKAGTLPFYVAGKTGTTNESKDAWFIGYSSELVAGVWLGFDTRLPLGGNETGASLALPIWRSLMEKAAAQHFPPPPVVPEGVVFERRSLDNGRSSQAGAVMALVAPTREPRVEAPPGEGSEAAPLASVIAKPGSL